MHEIYINSRNIQKNPLLLPLSRNIDKLLNCKCIWEWPQLSHVLCETSAWTVLSRILGVGERGISKKCFTYINWPVLLRCVIGRIAQIRVYLNVLHNSTWMYYTMRNSRKRKWISTWEETFWEKGWLQPPLSCFRERITTAKCKCFAHVDLNLASLYLYLVC